MGWGRPPKTTLRRIPRGHSWPATRCCVVALGSSPEDTGLGRAPPPHPPLTLHPLQHSWRHLYGCRSSHHANTTAANCAQDLTRNLAIGRDTNNYAYAASPTNSTRRQQPRAPREQARTRRQQPGALTTTSTGRDRGSYAEAPPTTTQTMRHKLCEQSRGRSFAQAQRSGRITTGLEEPRDERSRRGGGVPSPGPYPLGSFQRQQATSRDGPRVAKRNATQRGPGREPPTPPGDCRHAPKD